MFHDTTTKKPLQVISLQRLRWKKLPQVDEFCNWIQPEKAIDLIKEWILINR